MWDGTYVGSDGPSLRCPPQHRWGRTPVLPMGLLPDLYQPSPYFILFGTLDSASLILFSLRAEPSCIHGGHCTEPGVWLVSNGLVGCVRLDVPGFVRRKCVDAMGA